MITISLCMIVKNEEQTLERCLASIEGVADEIIIVDTGSTDRTKEIALKWTPHVYDFAWIDDFSAARNASFQYATQDYILWLDADDTLAPEERLKLLELKEKVPEEANAVTMHYAMVQEGNSVVATQAIRLRMVKRGAGFEWRGFVHEDLHNDGHIRLVQSSITITHNWREKGAPHSSSTRNLNMYEKHLARGHVLNVSEMYHYASECQIHKKFDQAIIYFEQCKASSEVPTATKLGIMHKLAACYALSGRPDKEMELTLESFTLDLPYPAFSCRMGEYFLMQGNIDSAINWYSTAVSTPLGEKHEWFFVDAAFHTWLPHHQLALCYEAIGKPDQARYHREMADSYRKPA